MSEPVSFLPLGKVDPDLLTASKSLATSVSSLGNGYSMSKICDRAGGQRHEGGKGEKAGPHLLVDGEDLGSRVERELALLDVVPRSVEAERDGAAGKRRGERRLDVPARVA